MQRFSLLTGFAALCLLLAGSCSDKPQPAPAAQAGKNAVQAAADPDELIPAGDLRNDRITFQLAVYYLPKPQGEPLAEINRLLKEKFPALQRVEKIDDASSGRAVAARIETDVKNSYAPPEAENLQYFGRGIDREQALALQAAEQAAILDFAHSNEQVWKGLREAMELTDALARSTGGLLWDETTREVFTPDAWRQRRLDDWTEEVPQISKYIVIHAYQKDEYVRAITLGMQKFGLPDAVIENFSWSTNRSMGNLLNLFVQALAEGAEAREAGKFDLDLKAIKHPKVREAEMASLKSKATGVAQLTLKKGTWEEGDPPNRLIEIAFDRVEGPDVHARQNQLLSQTFGAEDQISYVKHDEALLAASRQARTKLPALRKEFNEGLAPGEFVQLKAPFETPDGGQEWMWVEVTAWDGDKVRGLLTNEPFDIPTLHAGQIVEISEADVFDFIRRHRDGSSEGNETGKLLEKQSN